MKATSLSMNCLSQENIAKSGSTKQNKSSDLSIMEQSLELLLKSQKHRFTILKNSKEEGPNLSLQRNINLVC